MKKIVVVGSGINGLVAANYLAKNNFHVTIIEKKDTVGGACVKDTAVINGKDINYAHGATVLGMMQKFVFEETGLDNHVKTYFPKEIDFFISTIDYDNGYVRNNNKEPPTIVDDQNSSDYNADKVFYSITTAEGLTNLNVTLPSENIPGINIIVNLCYRTIANNRANISSSLGLNTCGVPQQPLIQPKQKNIESNVLKWPKIIIINSIIKKLHELEANVLASGTKVEKLEELKLL